MSTLLNEQKPTQHDPAPDSDRIRSDSSGRTWPWLVFNQEYASVADDYP